MTQRKVLSTHSAPEGHWVGDGFPVKSILSPRLGSDISPFLLFDHAGPQSFEPSDTPRGVDVHPHKGFETVTVVFEGELEHRDSAGNSAKISPGDVQWMTAGSGVLHEEKHSVEFTQSGGEFHVVQLWVNLRAADKLSQPGYQTLLAKDISEIVIGESKLRVIAGEVDGTKGPARTHTPMNVWDVGLSGELSLAVPEGHNAMAIVLAGSADVAGETLNVDELAIFERDGESVMLAGSGRVMVLTGEPIDEPIAAYGPFVMNTQEEIRETINEFQSGKFGSL